MKPLWMLLALATIAPPAAWAQDRTEDRQGDDTHVAVSVDDFDPAAGDHAAYSPGDKLLRGLANIGTSVVEIPRNIYITTQERNMLEGWTVGLAKGVGYTGLRLGAGLYETVTFPFPVPRGFEPIIRPEFVWQAEGPPLLNDEERRVEQRERVRESGT